MDYLPGTCPINTNLVDLCRIVANIFNVTKNMTPPILTDKIPKIGSQTHIGHCRFVISPFLNWKSFEEEKTSAIEQLLADFVQ